MGGHIERIGDMRNAHNILVGKPEYKRQTAWWWTLFLGE
jgi:hypothetical protein